MNEILKNTQLTKTDTEVTVSDGPLTTPMTAYNSSLLLNEIDSRVVKVRPMATPIDQISRMVGARKASSMIVDYYSVDARNPEVTISAPVTQVDGAFYSGNPVFNISVTDATAVSSTETLVMPQAVDSQGRPLVFYIIEADKTSGKPYTAILLNGNDESLEGVSEIGEAGDKLVRMGRAAGELEVQTPQFEALPVKSTNYCQIFKAQVEQSTLMKLSAKEVGWSLSDQEEVAIMDMRLGMEKSFLFGIKARITDTKRFDEILFTGGIWNQAGSEYVGSRAAFDSAAIISLMRSAFTGDCSGSSRKILVGGSGLIEAINNLDYTRVVTSGETVSRWGIDFSELRSKFGSLYVVHSEVFDQCGHADDGMIIDPQYLTKYSHIPFKVEHLDLKTSGQRNCDALVATEASCLVLRHPKAHLRVILN